MADPEPTELPDDDDPDVVAGMTRLAELRELEKNIPDFRPDDS